MTENGQRQSDTTTEDIAIYASMVQVPIEVNGVDKFTLIIVTEISVHAGATQTQYRLWIRCNDCNWGRNSNGAYLQLGDLGKTDDAARTHAGKCPHTGRTLSITSLEV